MAEKQTIRLLAVRSGETVWEREQRLESLSGAPLSEQGREVSLRLGKELVPHEPSVIYTASGEAEQQTARLISEETGIRIKVEKRLAEIDFGMWQGLTIEEIKRRQPSLHKQWLEAPASARPPGGETLSEAQKRIHQAIKTIVKKERKQTPVLVLRPIALGLLRCLLEKSDVETIWEKTNGDRPVSQYEVNPEEL
jgi:broad specificity phosphatase PhoE